VSGDIQMQPWLALFDAKATQRWAHLLHVLPDISILEGLDEEVVLIRDLD
jgi:hypothetical protein